MKLPVTFFARPDVVIIARELLGKKLVTSIQGQLTAGLINETEAYDGAIDRASHAWPNKRTLRTSVMFEIGGRTYVYFCYGVHHLFNIVTGPKDAPQAVLIRGIIPTQGIEVMKQRRGKTTEVGLTNGPGKVAQALGLTLEQNNLPLDSVVWVEDGLAISPAEVITTPRVGVDYAGADKDLPWRFMWQSKTG